MEFEGKTVVVTGSARGIGKEIATCFARRGANVVVSDLNEEECSETLGSIKALGGKAIAVKCDVSLAEEVEAMFDSAVKEFGGVDVLVNNAGIFPFIPFAEMTEEQWDKVLDVNLKGTFLCSKKAAEIMTGQGRGGNILNISSIAAIMGYSSLVHYCASKGGINSFTKALALALAPHKIRVNAVMPGPIRTPGSESMGEEELEKTAAIIPLRRMGESVDIANAVLFLASKEADFITGQCLVVDGGLTVK